MSEFRVERLAQIKTPLVNKFYTLHKARGRANKQDEVWVAYQAQQIIAACRFQKLDKVLFLSTVLVAPDFRGQKVASRLIKSALSAQTQAVYTFSYVDTIELYKTLGFEAVNSLPNCLINLFNIYQHRNIIALAFFAKQPTALPQ